MPHFLTYILVFRRMSAWGDLKKFVFVLRSFSTLPDFLTYLLFFQRMSELVHVTNLTLEMTSYRVTLWSTSKVFPRILVSWTQIQELRPDLISRSERVLAKYFIFVSRLFKLWSQFLPRQIFSICHPLSNICFRVSSNWARIGGLTSEMTSVRVTYSSTRARFFSILG